MGIVSDYIAKQKAIKEIGKENYNQTVEDIKMRFAEMYDATGSFDRDYVDGYLSDLGSRKSASKVSKIFELVSACGLGYAFTQMISNEPDPENLSRLLALLPVTFVASAVIDILTSKTYNDNVEYLSRYLKNHIGDHNLVRLRDDIYDSNGLSDMKRFENFELERVDVNDIEMSDEVLNSCYKTAARELI